MSPTVKKIAGPIAKVVGAMFVVLVVVFTLRGLVNSAVKFNNEVDTHTFRIIGGPDVRRMQTSKDGKPIPLVFMVGADWTTRGYFYQCTVDQQTYEWADHLAGMEITIPIYRCLLIAPK